MVHSGAEGRPSDDTRRTVRELAERQHGVVVLWQLVALGIAGAWVGRAVDRGHLIRVHRGVYAVGHAQLTLHGRWIAAVLACGPGALLSHHAAAALHQLRTAPTGLIEVTARAASRRVAGVRTHRARRSDAGTTIDAIPVTTLERPLLDHAAISNRRRLDAALDTLERSGRLNPRRIHDTVDAARGHNGAGPLTAALSGRADEASWTQSELARDFLALVRDAGLPEPRCNVFVDGLLVDFYWPQFELVIEVHGYGFHRSRQRFESDRANDTIHALAGRRTIRPTYRRIQHDRAGLRNDLSRLIAAGPRGGTYRPTSREMPRRIPPRRPLKK